MIARSYKILTWLSLDVTVGAIVFMYFLSAEFGTPVHWRESAALGLAVWLIYSVDHLLDARVATGALSPRREFHRKHAKTLLLVSVFLAIVGIWIVAHLSVQVRIFGIGMAVIAGGYLILAQLKRWSNFKELQISLSYGSGVSLIPMVHIEEIIIWHWVVISLLFLLALFNLTLFSWYERAQDETEGFQSLALYFSEKNLGRMLWVLLGLSLIGVGGLVFIGGSRVLPLFFLVGVVVNLIIWRYPNFFGRNEAYRIIGDSVFLFPIIWLF